MARIMGLDIGSKTIGIALSDPLGWTAQGLKIIHIDELNNDFGISMMSELISKYDIIGFVIGLPKNMDNTLGERAQSSLNYGNMLKKKFKLPIDFIDERLTTVEAQRMLIEEADISRNKRNKIIDKLAAVLILQNYLDAKGNLLKLL